jgi:hypothetical protein
VNDLICERCESRPATTHQEYRHSGDAVHWENRKTERCDECARALRDYAKLPSISLFIVLDRPYREERA